MLQYVISGMLCHGPLTGYDIKKYIEEGVGVFYKASYGSLYPTLKRLAEQGCVTLEESRQGRSKKYYTLTTQGREAFQQWLLAPLDVNDDVSNHLVKVYFFDLLPQEDSERLLREFELGSAMYLRRLEALEKRFTAMGSEGAHYYKLSTLYYGIAVVQKNLDWCRHIRERKPLADFIKREAAQ